MRSALRAAVLILVKAWAFPRIGTYSGSKSRSTSTPSLLFGRSMMWPLEAITVKPRPRNLVRVRDLVGDSTITRDFALPGALVRAPALRSRVAPSLEGAERRAEGLAPDSPAARALRAGRRAVPAARGSSPGCPGLDERAAGPPARARVRDAPAVAPALPLTDFAEVGGGFFLRLVGEVEVAMTRFS